MAGSAERSGVRSPDLGAFAAITDAVEAGAGLPEILRAAARALDASLILIDRSATVLAVAARSPADERSLMRDADDVTTVELKVAEASVGQLRMRTREPHPRRRAAAAGDDADRLRGRARPGPGTCLRGGGDELPARGSVAADRGSRRPAGARQGARHRPVGRQRRSRSSAPTLATRPRMTGAAGCWRSRRAARARSRPGSIAAPTEVDAGEIVVLLPDADGEAGRRVVGGDAARARVRPRRVLVRARPQPPGRGPARSAPRLQRGAAGAQRRRGRQRAHRARLRGDRHLPAAAPVHE